MTGRFDRSDPGWRWAGALLLGVCGLAAWLARWPRFDGSAETLIAAAWTATLLLALGVAVTATLHRRATSEAAGIYVGTVGCLLIAASAFDLLNGLEPAVGRAAIVRAAISITAALWLARAATGPPVDTSPSLLRQGATALAVALATVSVGLLSALASPSGASTAVAAHLVASLVWLAVTMLVVLRLARGSSLLVAWTLWLALAMTVAEAARALAIAEPQTWLFAAAKVRGTGGFLMVIGAAYALARSTTARRDELHLATVQEHQRRRDHVAEHDLDAHELRNAVITVEGAIGTLLENTGTLHPDERTDLGVIVRDAVSHLRALIEAPSCGDVRPLTLLPLAMRQRTLARLRGLRVEVTGDERLQVTADRRALVQVLDNLLRNAELHGEAGGPTQVEIEVTPAGERAELRVRDHGPGIPTGQHELIFAPGVRLDPRRPGRGLGLAVARQKARQQGGDLYVEDAPGGGACFVLSLPIRDASATASADSSPAEGNAMFGGTVEDEPQHVAHFVEPTAGKTDSGDRPAATG